MDRRAFLIGAGAGLGGLLCGNAHAAGATMKFVYPYSPGSGGDALVRLLADDMQ